MIDKKTTGEDRKQKWLARLVQWIEETTATINEKAPGLKYKSTEGQAGNRPHFMLNSDIDFDQFTRADLKALQPALEALHDVCQKHDIALDIRGLDLLPRHLLVSQNCDNAITTPSVKSSFLICFDASRPFNYAANPYSPAAAQKLHGKRKAAPRKTMRPLKK